MVNRVTFYLLHLVSYFFHHVFGVYKENSAEELAEENHDTTTLHVSSLNGVTIIFHCKKLNFVIKNDHPYIPDYKFSVYKLSAECGQEKCTDKLKIALLKTAYFPKLRMLFISEEKRRSFLIETYISLINSDLKNKKT